MGYGVAKVVNAFCIGAGWLITAAGLILLFISGEDSWAVALMKGGLLIAYGLGLVALYQMANATIHTAEESRTTNDLLRQLIARPAARVGNLPPAQATSSKSEQSASGDTNSLESSSQVATTGPQSSGERQFVVKICKGHFIKKVEGKGRFYVDGQAFDSLQAAEKYVSTLEPD